MIFKLGLSFWMEGRQRLDLTCFEDSFPSQFIISVYSLQMFDGSHHLFIIVFDENELNISVKFLCLVRLHENQYKA